jgi:twitching motility protein PilT
MPLKETLRATQLSDIYIGSKSAWLGGVPGTFDPALSPPEFESEIEQLRKLCEDARKDRQSCDFSFACEGIKYRGTVFQSLQETVFVLRRFPEMVPGLESLNLPAQMVSRLVAPSLSGLLVISGEYANGKTTTASAILKSRLVTLGGVAMTIENPPEMPLEGRHGEGVCFQTWAEKGEFATSCRMATRCNPSMLFIGEIRDSETAMEAMRTALNGRLVICTTHADGVKTTLERLYALGTSISNSEDVANNLSSGLLGVIHQKLIRHGDVRRLMVESLWVPGSDQASIRSMIKSRSWEQIGTTIQRQKAEMLNAVQR